METKIIIGDCECEIVNTKQINSDAELLICDYTAPKGSYGSTTFSAIRYADGTIFTVWDWEGEYPETVADIPDYKWRLEDTQRVGIMVNGLPRLLI